MLGPSEELDPSLPRWTVVRLKSFQWELLFLIMVDSYIQSVASEKRRLRDGHTGATCLSFHACLSHKSILTRGERSNR